MHGNKVWQLARPDIDSNSVGRTVAYAKAGTEYLFVSALCALANLDLILANKRIDTSFFFDKSGQQSNNF